MAERRCRYCEQIFVPSKYQPAQAAARADYHRHKIATDPVYRQECLDSPQKWRARHPDYWRQYRQQHPAVVERNRRQQQVRDQKRRLGRLANNNSVFDLKHWAAEIWLLGPDLSNLANNNSVPAQVWVLETFPPRKPPASESCKQQRPGVEAASAG